MHTFWWQIQDWWLNGNWHIFAIYFLFVWAVMLPRMICARIFYWLVGQKKIQQYPAQKYRVSALVTEFKEGSSDFERCLKSLRKSLEYGTECYEIIVVHDGTSRGERAHLARISEQYATRVLTSNVKNKRKNLKDLVQCAQGDIVVLVDSDTDFEKKTIFELCRPFADLRIGGTTTAQRIYKPHTIMQRMSDWMENARLQSSMAMASLFTQVACLPGRAIAFRKSVIEDHMDALVGETFLGKPCISGDDRFLTNVVLRKGSRTILVPDARVTTLAPEGFEATSRMWTRWGRSSQRYTMFSPWLFRYPVAAFIYWSDIFLAPATVFILFIHWPYAIFFGSRDLTWMEMVLFSAGGVLLSMFIRQFFHLLKHPRDLLYLPVFVLIATYLQIIRTYALCTIFQVNVWGTRKGADDRNADTGSHSDTGARAMIFPSAPEIDRWP